MIRHTTAAARLAAASAFVLLAAQLTGCLADNGSVFIEGILPIPRADDCVVDPNGGVFQSGSLLDLGDQVTPNALVVAMRVVTNLPNTFAAQDDSQSQTRSPNFPDYGNSDSNVINFTDSEVYFTTDADRDGAPALTGVVQTTGYPPTLIGVGGTVYNTQSQLNTGAAIIATVITQENSLALQGWLGTQGGRGRVLANLRLRGTTTGSGAVRTPPFIFPVELCMGCLVVDVTACQNGTEDLGCIRGVDYPTVCAAGP